MQYLLGHHFFNYGSLFRMQSILSFLHTDVLSLPNVFFKPNYSIHFNYTCSHVTSFFQFIIIIIILGISFMQDIYTYIPEKNHVPREHCVAAILVLLFVVLISLVPALTLLYPYVSTFRSTCSVPSMAVFCSSLTT